MDKDSYKGRRWLAGLIMLIISSSVSYYVFQIGFFEIGSSGIILSITFFTGQLIYEGYMRLRHPDIVKKLFVDEMDERAQMISYQTSSLLLKLFLPLGFLLLLYLDVMGKKDQSLLIAYVMLFGTLLHILITAYYKRKN